MTDKWRSVLGGALAAGAMAIAGCGGGDEEGGGGPTPAPTPPPAGGGTTLQLKADTSALLFDKRTLQVKAGDVTLVMENPAAIPHNVAIEGGGVDEEGEVVSKGGTSRVTATLKAGTYEFYCSVPGHREAGMKGTLTVK